MTRQLVLDDMYEPEPNSGCWLWLGKINNQGYGWAGKRGSAHRALYIALRGPIPNGLILDHKCRVRCCVNPDHLEAVTDRENVARGFSPSAVNARKTHCIRGHELAGDNLYRMPDGDRACRACRNEASRRYRRSGRRAQGAG